MARNFRAFVSTVNPFRPGGIFATRRVLVDQTGASVGIQSDGDAPDGIWAPVDVTSAQIAAPSAAMIADINSTYRLNVAPYTRYVSNGTALVSQDPGSDDVIPASGPFSNVVLYAPVTITAPEGLTVLGQARVINYAA